MRVFRDTFGNRGRVWHVDDPAYAKRNRYIASGLCGVNLGSHVETQDVPNDTSATKICAKCRREQAKENIRLQDGPQ